MQRSIGWYQVIAISLLLHGVLVSGVGLLSRNDKMAAPEEEYIEMQLVSVPVALQEAPPLLDDSPPTMENSIAEEAIEQEKTPDVETKVLDKEKEQRDDSRAKAISKREPVTKDVPTQMLLHYNKKQLELALLQYSQALAMNSQVASVYSNRGQVYYDKGEVDNALSDFNQALKINPQLASAHIGRGYIYIKKGQWDLAFDDFNLGLTVNPQNALAYYGRALCFSVQGDKQNAIHDFQLFIQYATPDHDRFIKIAQQSISKLKE